MGKWDSFINSLTGTHNANWGIKKLIEFKQLLDECPELLIPAKETLTRTEFFVVQRSLRMEILHSCGNSSYQDRYDRNVQDLIWCHNNWVNGNLFTVVSKIVVCCGGRITTQY